MAPHGGKPPWLPSTPTCWRPRRDGPWSESGEAGEFDLSARRQHIIAGALRIGHYRSAGLYLDAAIWHQENQLHTPVSAALRRAAKTLTKAALRGLPGSRLKQAFDLDELAQLVVQDEADEPFDVTRVEHAVDVVVVATWFMLREIEIAGTKVKDLTVTGTTMRLRVGGAPIVPQIRRLASHRRILATTACRPDDFLFPTGPGAQRTKAESAEMFRMLHLRRSRGSRSRRHLPGGERGGRWASTAVERYALQAPLAVAAGIPAQALLASSSHPQPMGRAPVTAAPLALTHGHERTQWTAAPGAPGGPVAGIPAAGLSARAQCRVRPFAFARAGWQGSRGLHAGDVEQFTTQVIHPFINDTRIDGTDFKAEDGQHGVVTAIMTHLFVEALRQWAAASLAPTPQPAAAPASAAPGTATTTTASIPDRPPRTFPAWNLPGVEPAGQHLRGAAARRETAGLPGP
eukprot:s1143_g12.t1